MENHIALEVIRAGERQIWLENKITWILSKQISMYWT